MRRRFRLRNPLLIGALAAVGFAAIHDGIIRARDYFSGALGLSVSNQSPAEPTNIQWFGDALFSAGGSSNPTGVVVPVVDPTEQGDTLFVVGQFGSSGDIISTIADDQGGTLANLAWAKDKIQGNATDNQGVCILRRSNCPANVRKVTLGFTGQVGFSQFATLKANNLLPTTPVLSTGATPAATTSIAAGNITTTVENCFYVYAAANTSPGTPSGPLRFTAPSDTNDQKNCLFAAAGPDGFTGMYGMKYSAGTFNPTMTAGTSWTRAAVAACAYQCAPGVGSKALTSYAGRVKFKQVINFATTFNSGGGYGTTQTFDVPCDTDVNGIAFTYDDPNAIFKTNAASNTSSSPSNTWSATTPQQCGSGAGPWTGFVYNTNGSYSKNMSLTLTFSSAPNHSSPTMLAIVHGLVNVGALDSVQGNGANPNVAVPVTRSNVLSTPISPSQRNAIILLHSQEDQQTVTNITATNGGDFLLGMPDWGIYSLNESEHDGGLGHMYHAGDPNTSYNFNLTYSNYEGGLNLTNYGLQVIAFTCLQPHIAWDYTKEPKSPVRKVFS